MVIFQRYGGFILVISSSLPKIKYVSFGVMEKGFIVFDAGAVINSGHLNFRWQRNLNGTPCNKVKSTVRVLCN